MEKSVARGGVWRSFTFSDTLTAFPPLLAAVFPPRCYPWNSHRNFPLWAQPLHTAMLPNTYPVSPTFSRTRRCRTVIYARCDKFYSWLSCFNMPPLLLPVATGTTVPTPALSCAFNRAFSPCSCYCASYPQLTPRAHESCRSFTSLHHTKSTSRSKFYVVDYCHESSIYGQVV